MQLGDSFVFPLKARWRSVILPSLPNKYWLHNFCILGPELDDRSTHLIWPCWSEMQVMRPSAAFRAETGRQCYKFPWWGLEWERSDVKWLLYKLLFSHHSLSSSLPLFRWLLWIYIYICIDMWNMTGCVFLVLLFCSLDFRGEHFVLDYN